MFRYYFHIKYDNHIYLFSRSLCQQQRRQTVLYSKSMPLSYAINIQDNKTEFNVDIQRVLRVAQEDGFYVERKNRTNQQSPPIYLTRINEPHSYSHRNVSEKQNKIAYVARQHERLRSGWLSGGREANGKRSPGGRRFHTPCKASERS